MSFTCFDANGHPFQAVSLTDCLEHGSTVPPPPILQPQGPIAGSQQALAQGGQIASNVGSTVSSVTGIVGSTVSSVTGSKLWANINDATFWKRAALVGAGGLLVLLGASGLLFGKVAPLVKDVT